ncbi:hypothetical protein [Amycolatopsis suaedae]|uniref:Uncharacterized protein n=1 Tax=Amycolatopsis suaedae TaxID=2510978 RepID=A0A4V2ELB1_9PSEU|nr:hypothetical protein [Amycolatopsis suaedae]RZQ60945.1 hypothetical protein EWH70_26010 [Amycolatopsis suaedae]
MTTRRHSGSERLANARASQERRELDQHAKALCTVDEHATDPRDRAMLIAMLGLDEASSPAPVRDVGPLS